MASALPTLASSGALGTTPGSSAQRRSRRPQQPYAPHPQDQGDPTGQPMQAPTFAQMQANGQARPAPPSAPPTSTIPQYRGSQQAGQVRGQLQQSVEQALANPSRYDTSTFNTIRDAAYGDIKDQFAKIRDTTNTDLARRGLAASTFGANDLHDVDAAQSRAMADLNANLLKDAAATQASDRSAAYGMGSDLAGLAGSQDLAAYGANANTANQNFQNALAQRLGEGNLALSEGSLTGTYNGAPTQAASQFQKTFDQSNSQFGQTYDLNKTAQAQQAQQFKDQLAQSLGIAQMGNDTQNRALQQGANESTNTFIAQLLQALGPGADLSKIASFLPPGTLPSTGLTPTTPTPTPTTPRSLAPITEPNKQAVDQLAAKIRAMFGG